MTSTLELLTAGQRELLLRLAREWRDYALTSEPGYDKCADDLEALVAQWSPKRTDVLVRVDDLAAVLSDVPLRLTGTDPYEALLGVVKDASGWEPGELRSVAEGAS